MSDAIEVQDLSKVYKRYASNFWKAAGLLGLPVPASRYDEFRALDGVSFKIGRGERVALVGRNGAGKSTLLRHISGELTGTSGEVRVNGSVKALFGLGDGFHPEFSGLQNVKTALALNGIAWGDMSRAAEEVVEFAELEDFIARPLREYSAGMYARLAFAVATATRPDILIIDEILGAGDAYFLGKCLQRIRDMTDHGSTVLFVSHDMGSALMLCQRGLWIHQGRLRESGDMTAIARSYHAHIRAEQDLALRARSMKLSKRALRNEPDAILVRLVGADGTAPKAPAYVARMAFGDRDLALGETEFGNQDQSGRATPIIDAKASNWGKAVTVNGRRARPFGDFGAQASHAPVTLRWEGYAASERPWIEMDVLASPASALSLQIFQPESGEYRNVVEIPPEPHPVWRVLRAPLPLASGPETRLEPAQSAFPIAPRPGGEAGEAAPASTAPDRSEGGASQRPVSIREFGFLDEAGIARHTLISGRSATIRFRAWSALTIAEPIAVVAIYRPDGLCISQMISRGEQQTGRLVQGEFEIEAVLEELLIGPGDYVVSAALFSSLDPSKSPEDRAYELLDRSFALKIVDSDFDFFPTGVVRQQARWSMRKLAHSEGAGVAELRGEAPASFHFAIRQPETTKSRISNQSRPEAASTSNRNPLISD